MFLRRIGLSAVLACLTLAAGRGTADDRKTPDELAREAVLAYVKAANARDVDAAMKVVDVPFYFTEKIIVKGRDEMRKILEVAARRKNGEFSLRIQDVGTLEQMEKKTGKVLKEEKRKPLIQVLGKEHRIVRVEITNDLGTTKAAFAVRIDGSKAVVVGHFD